MKFHPVLKKVLALGGVMLLMVLALSQIDGLADERRGRFAEAESSVEASLAGRQTLIGPMLLAQCREEWTSQVGEGAARKTTAERRDFQFMTMPQRLEMKTQVTMEPLHRGLFKVNTYAARSTLNAAWPVRAVARPAPTRPDSRVSCDAPTLMVALNDPRGIRQAQVKVDGSPLAIDGGTGSTQLPRGFHAALPAAARADAGPLEVEVVLDLVGTADLAVVPIAGDNKVVMNADWPHPSFGGRFLPLTREVRSDGFSATWQVSSLATTAAADIERGATLCAPAVLDADALAPDGKQARCIEAFRVGFIDPVNPYSLSDRATKYGLLFVGLTFLAIWMVEVLWQLRVHPFQYLFVGSAVSIFFLLLLSLSEHLSFGISYAIAASGCAMLLAFYGRYLLRGIGAGIAFGFGIATLYGVLYLLLQLEQTALVVGSVMLFVILAGLMTATRKVDWHRLLGENAAPSPLATAVR